MKYVFEFFIWADGEPPKGRAAVTSDADEALHEAVDEIKAVLAKHNLTVMRTGYGVRRSRTTSS